MKKFICPLTNKLFEAQKVKLANGEVGWFTPLWVKSLPNEWKEVSQK